MFPFPQHQVPLEQRTNVVYHIPCSNYPWSYVGNQKQEDLPKLGKRNALGMKEIVK